MPEFWWPGRGSLDEHVRGFGADEVATVATVGIGWIDGAGYWVSGWTPHGSAGPATTAYFFLVVGVAFVGGAAMPKALSMSMWQVSLK